MPQKKGNHQHFRGKEKECTPEDRGNLRHLLKDPAPIRKRKGRIIFTKRPEKRRKDRAVTTG